MTRGLARRDLTVDRDGSLQLHAPAGCEPEALAMWAYTKRMWVYRKLAEKDLLLSVRPRREFVTGEAFAYLGRSYRLLLAETPTVKLERGRLLLPRGCSDADAASALIRWYRTRGEDWLPARLKPWAQRMGLRPSGLDVRDLGYRWGSLARTTGSTSTGRRCNCRQA
jgi:predicted metal-dependent hydrolase